jgi:hypothetical protein
MDCDSEKKRKKFFALFLPLLQKLDRLNKQLEQTIYASMKMKHLKMRCGSGSFLPQAVNIRRRMRVPDGQEICPRARSM